MYMDQEGMTLASEILAELKASARRWFIAFLVMIGIEIATICGFLWYISLPVDDAVTMQSVDAENNGEIDQHVGDYYEGGSDNTQNPQSNTQ